MRLKDKVALVTGAGSGMGAAIAQGYLKEGARVVFADINVGAAQKVAQDSGISEDMWLATYIDVGNHANVKECIEHTVQKFGRLDISRGQCGNYHTEAISRLNRRRLRPCDAGQCERGIPV